METYLSETRIKSPFHKSGSASSWSPDGDIAACGGLEETGGGGRWDATPSPPLLGLVPLSSVSTLMLISSGSTWSDMVSASEENSALWVCCGPCVSEMPVCGKCFKNFGHHLSAIVQMGALSITFVRKALDLALSHTISSFLIWQFKSSVSTKQEEQHWVSSLWLTTKALKNRRW
jgi:hypothetical protein